MDGAVDQTRRYGLLDRPLVALAARQHGVFALWQVRSIGLTENAVQKRSRAGRLYRLYRGVYSLMPGSLLSRDGRWLAAVLACGPGAALSHRSAAHLHELRATSREGVDVIVPRDRERRYAGIDAHQSTHLTAGDLTIVRAIPVTTVARMMLDIAAVVEQRAVERVIDEAEVSGVFDLRAIRDQLERNRSIRGRPACGRPWAQIAPA
jgi:predicted transcriptional regulator of viral defense system